MKRLILLILTLVLVGCTQVLPTTEKFVITSTETWSSKNKTYRYHVRSVIGAGDFYMVSRTVYAAGDTLILKPTKP